MRVLGRPGTTDDERFEALFRREFAPLVRALTRSATATADAPSRAQSVIESIEQQLASRRNVEA